MASKEYPQERYEFRIEKFDLTVRARITVNRDGHYTWYISHLFRMPGAIGVYSPSRRMEYSLAGAKSRLESYIRQFESAEDYEPSSEF
jgi:hypothetical protein